MTSKAICFLYQIIPYFGMNSKNVLFVLIFLPQFVLFVLCVSFLSLKHVFDKTPKKYLGVQKSAGVRPKVYKGGKEAQKSGNLFSFFFGEKW